MDVLGEKWCRRFMNIALESATWSKDPHTKTGAAIVTLEGDPVSWGFNGIPKKVEDREERYQRPEKYKWIQHAERNAIDLSKYDLKNCVIFCTHFPCHECAKSIIQKGIVAVVVDSKHFQNSNSGFSERWAESLEISKQMLEEANIKIIKIGTNDE